MTRVIGKRTLIDEVWAQDVKKNLANKVNCRHKWFVARFVFTLKRPDFPVS